VGKKLKEQQVPGSPQFPARQKTKEAIKDGARNSYPEVPFILGLLEHFKLQSARSK